MRPLIHLMILRMICAIVASRLDPETAKSYVDFILEVYKSSESSSITLMFAFKQDDSLKKDLIFDIQVLLFKDGITSSAINPSSMRNLDRDKLFKFMRTRQNDRAMRVFFVTSKSGLERLFKKSRFLKGNILTNLVLFVGTGNNITVDVCMKPHRNPFHLDKGISVLVKCYGDPVIREWHSLKGNEIEIHERAVWEPKIGLTLKSEKLFLDDRDKLNGNVLSAGIKQKSSSYRMKFLDEVFTSLGHAGNFTIENVRNHKLWNSSTKSAFKGTKLDLIKDLYVLEPDANYIVEYSETLREIRYDLTFKQPQSRVVVLWSAYLQPFTIEVWIALVLLFLVIQAVRIYMISKLRTDQRNENSVVNDFTYICGIYCQQGLPEFPKKTSLRIFYFSVFLLSTGVMIMWSATFVSELTMIDEELPFKTLDEFSRQQTYKLLVSQHCRPLYRDLKNARTSPSKELGHLLLDWTKLPENNRIAEDWVKSSPQLDSHYDNHMRNLSSLEKINELFQICRGDKVAVLEFNIPDAPDDYKRGRCSLVNIDAGGNKFLSFQFPRFSPYSRGINQILKRLKTTGILQRISSVQRRMTKKLFSIETRVQIYPIIGIWDVSVPFTLLLGSMVLSFMILFSEGLYSWFQGRKKSKAIIHRRPAAARLRRVKRKLQAGVTK